MHQVLAALTHAGISASFYVLLRQWYPHHGSAGQVLNWSFFDRGVLATGLICLLVAALLRRSRELTPAEGAARGIMACCFMVISLIALIIYGEAGKLLDASLINIIKVFGIIIGIFALTVAPVLAAAGSVSGIVFGRIQKMQKNVQLLMHVLVFTTAAALPIIKEITALTL